MNNAPTEEKIEIARRVDKVRNICDMEELFRNMFNIDRLTQMIEE
jgi:hypothetical protein